MAIPCTCPQCLDHHRVRETLRRRDPGELASMVREFLERAECAEMDGERYEAICAGTWPGAVALLEEWLERARAAGKEG